MIVFKNCISMLSILFWRLKTYLPPFEHCMFIETLEVTESDLYIMLTNIYLKFSCLISLMGKPFVMGCNSDFSFIERCWTGPTACLWWSAVGDHGRSKGRLLLLNPTVHRKKRTRNEPCNISISAEFIAQVKGISVEEVQEVTTQNALKLFPKLQNLLQK